jgi:hypothetical protein
MNIVIGIIIGIISLSLISISVYVLVKGVRSLFIEYNSYTLFGWIFSSILLISLFIATIAFSVVSIGIEYNLFCVIV